MPLRTNSTTACEDWQSQMPAKNQHYIFVDISFFTLTIASNDKKLIIICVLVNSHIWERCDNLLLRREICALLEFEVAQGSAERKVAVDSAEIDKAACCANTRLLAFILGFVVEREGFRAALDAEDRSRVTSVALVKSASRPSNTSLAVYVRRRSCRA